MVPHIAAWCGNRAQTMNYIPVDPFLNIKEVMRLTSLSRASIARYTAARRFPKPVRLSPGGRVAWRSSEIQIWANDPLDWDPDFFESAES